MVDLGVWVQVELLLFELFYGQMGIVEFGYDIVDECCIFEKGWYIDVLNIGMECVCVVDFDCLSYGSVCGLGQCLFMGECGLLFLFVDWFCGDLLSNDCDGVDICDG